MVRTRKKKASLGVPFSNYAGLVLFLALLCVGASFLLFDVVSTMRGSGSDSAASSAAPPPPTEPQQPAAASPRGEGGTTTARHHNNNHHRPPPPQQRLAILLPFIGSSPADIPPYLELFCVGAVGIANVADVLIFHNGVLDVLDSANGSTSACAKASNVQLINFQSTKRLMERFATKLLDQVETWSIPRNQFVPFLAKHTSYLPYTLVEYKPALGHVLDDWIPTDTYSHWAYSDLDILWGDLGRHLTTSDWTDFDILTYTFGDQERLYLRGQFTMHRNDPHRINQLWRDCPHLSRIDARFARLVQEKKDFKLESAEGCYSAVVLQYNDVSIKYATAAWTDIDRHDTAYSHGIQLIRDNDNVANNTPQRHLLVKRSHQDDGAVQQVDQLSYTRLSKSALYRDDSLPWKEPIGAMEPIDLPNDNDNKNNNDHSNTKSSSNTNDKDDPCRLFWIRKQYRHKLCLVAGLSSSVPITVHPHETVYWVEGQLYKQETRELSIQQGLLTGPFFHFQEWKRHFQAHQLTAILDPSLSSFILTEDGGLPIKYKEPTSIKLRTRQQPNQLSSPLGLTLRQWTGQDLLLDHNEGKPVSHRNRLLPLHTYCLRSGQPQRFHAIPCQDAVQWSDTERIRLLTAGTAWNQVHMDTEVTLCLTLQISSHEIVQEWSRLLQQNMDSWRGQPVVAIISLVEVPPDHAERSLTQLQEALQPYAATTFVAVIMPREEDHADEEEEKMNAVSRKTLMNMAIDMSPTRWYVCGMELERGLVMSRDSVVLALRAAETSVQSGKMFWIPQFGLKDGVGNSVGMFADPSVVSLKEMAQAKTNNGFQFPWGFDSSCDNDGGHALTLANNLWWRLSEDLLGPEAKRETDSTIAQRARSVEEMNEEILKFLESSDLLVKSAESPILLVDNAGPNVGIRAHTFVRHVEAFAGLRCFNLLQLALLVAGGYQMDVLGGAFALSSPKTRPTEPRGCDGCPVLNGHDKAKDALLVSEIHRIVNAAIIWENSPSNIS